MDAVWCRETATQPARAWSIALRSAQSPCGAGAGCLLPLTLWTLQVRLRLRDFVLTDRGLVFDSKVCPPPSLQ